MTSMVLQAGTVATSMHATAVRYQSKPDFVHFFVFIHEDTASMQQCRIPHGAGSTMATGYSAIPMVCICAWCQHMMLYMQHVIHLPAAVNMCMKMIVTELPGNNSVGSLNIPPKFDACMHMYV